MLLPLKGTAQELLHTLKTEPSLQVKQAALFGLAHYHPSANEFEEGLLEALRHPPLDVVALGIVECAQMNSLLPQVKQIATGDLQKSPRTTAAAVKAWAAIAPLSEQSLLRQWLIRYLSDPNLVIRAAAAGVLAESGDASGVAALGHLITSPILQDRLEALLHILELPDDVKLGLAIDGLKSEARVLDQDGVWDYRRRSLEILAGCPMDRSHWRVLRGTARRWRIGSEEKFRLLIHQLRSGMGLYVAVSRKVTPSRAQVQDYRSRMQRILKILESC
jgi:hypothetical protein